MKRDKVATLVSVRVGWLDRLRMLWHGRVEVRAVVETEHEVGATSTTSDAWVPRVIPRRGRAAQLSEVQP